MRVKSLATRALQGARTQRTPGTGLLIAGVVVFALIMASYVVYKISHPYKWTMDPVDLYVYRVGGLIVRHLRPFYSSHRAAPLYDWPGYTRLKLKFTYPPFAAVAFVALSFIPWHVLPGLVVLANIGLLLLALWFTFGGLGYQSRMRLGAALLAAAAVFWIEPVVRTIYLGQVNLALMALIMWDMCQPDRRWWKGAGVGIAAGIKIVPLIFIPYLLVTRRFRQAAVASAAFAASVLAGFVFLPADSAKWWFGGLVFDGGRTGFVAWVGNQSLRGLIARLMGSVAGSADAWLVVTVLVAAAGLACAAALDRKGHRVAGLLTCALVGLLASPISWDHHWVWIAPGIAVAAHYAVQAMDASGGLGPVAPGRAASPGPAANWRDWAARAWGWVSSMGGGYWALALGMLALYNGWPDTLFGGRPGAFDLGVLWLSPSTGDATYNKYGDQPWYSEYHWHGMQLITGNAYVLGGLVLLGVLMILAWIAPSQRPAAARAGAQSPAVDGSLSNSAV
jgi:alpha-1,2-mannosyltransferase